MDIKSIGMRVRARLREKSGVFLDAARLGAVALLFFGSGILYAQHFLFPQESVTLRQSTEDTVPMQAMALDAYGPASKTVSVQNKQAAPAISQTQEGPYVASKNGTKYYRTACKNRINNENKIYFQSEDDAKKSGYAPSATCFK